MMVSDIRKPEVTITLLVSLRNAESSRIAFAPAFARVGLLLAVAIGAAGGIWASGGVTNAATDAAGAELTQLLRAMAALKAAMALALVGAFLWRLAEPVGALRYGAAVAACGAMAAGTSMIWAMAHVGWGAIALHAGLLASALLLWFDPAVASRLSALVAERRRSL